MILKKSILLTGLACALTTSGIAICDDEISSDSPKTSENKPEVLQPASRPPVLLAPPKTTTPVSTDDPPEARKVSPTAKLSPSDSNVSRTLNGLKTSNGSLEQGFVSLLSGEGLAGWVVHEGRADAWKQDGETISCTGAGGGWLRTEKEYSDFQLKFEYKLQPGCNTGLGIRCPSDGNPTFTGIELQLLDDTAEKYKSLRADQYTGSLYYQVAPQTKPELKPAGEWNECEVICLGDQITVKMNGQVVNNINLARPTGEKPGTEKTWKLAERPPLGHLALQSHPSQVEFRNLRVKDLSIETTSGVRYVNLQDGEGEVFTDAKMVTVHYVGQLLDGTRFGDTRDLGEPVSVPVDGIIDGWKHGIEGMKVGGRRRLIVPPEMAYGSQGVPNLIPPGATLVFEVELCGFER
ncbi:family 16 glycoside hydrolase [Thalassoglobus polymorphus]|uniref:peptidylprolyl isomerase n=1 Tax=Thalassoglobus polymorphus TaxID=2527994 RepID=A0A517QKW9_9PLAN|nr:family 16 glycoside hydrolase [Thalassoglobus polymorphus]QDT32285.1 FKBP-type peptidyl-prolyl cis-trans isomerase FkpA precursor [Thalassoglobus polymorphus]